LVAGLALNIKDKSRVIFFGVDSWDEEAFGDENIIDTTTSPLSASKLIYSKRYYGHLGLYRSDNGDFSRPSPQVRVKKVIKIAGESSNFEVAVYDKNLTIKLPMAGLYNIYNCLSAIAATSQIKSVDGHDIASGLAVISPAFGRMEKISYHNRDFHLLLIKNPTGFNQVIQTFVVTNPKTKILIIINDDYADGRDVSWLWDSAVEKMQNHQAKIMVSGLRAYDMALRLKYAGITDFEVEANIDLALRKIISQTRAKEKIFILPTYTAMLNVRSKIVKTTKHKEFWK
jgi:UDP-N-acetylmuramyl tripeptide synthase